MAFFKNGRSIEYKPKGGGALSALEIANTAFKKAKMFLKGAYQLGAEMGMNDAQGSQVAWMPELAAVLFMQGMRSLWHSSRFILALCDFQDVAATQRWCRIQTRSGLMIGMTMRTGHGLQR